MAFPHYPVALSYSKLGIKAIKALPYNESHCKDAIRNQASIIEAGYRVPRQAVEDASGDEHPNKGRGLQILACLAMALGSLNQGALN
jgi:hypothetical protein